MKSLEDVINLITAFSQKTVSGRKLQISHETNLIYRLPLSRATTVPNFNLISYTEVEIPGCWFFVHLFPSANHDSKKRYTYEWLIKNPSDSLKHILLHKFEEKKLYNKAWSSC